MQNGRWYKLEVKCRLENLEIIDAFIVNTLQVLEISDNKVIHDIRLAVNEACTNIIYYAYPSQEEGVLSIRCGLATSRNKLIIIIEDWGKPFDPTTVPIPKIDTPLNERQEGGLGVFFIKKVMDKVKYSFIENHNELRIIKHLRK